jgi:hypothetical protein
MLSGFGKMLFGGRVTAGAAEDKSGQSVPPSGFSSSVSSVFNNGIMIVLASLIVVFGFRVPSFINSTLSTCMDIIGVK